LASPKILSGNLTLDFNQDKLIDKFGWEASGFL
jgi:hypothetical protein